MELSNEFETNENSGVGPSKKKATEDEMEELLQKLYRADKKSPEYKELREEWKRQYDQMEGVIHHEQEATQPAASATASATATTPPRAGAAAVVSREVSERHRYPANSCGDRRLHNMVGLQNQANLCYANSALQMLFFCRL